MNLNYFTLDEFDSPDAPGSGAEHMDQQFLMRLDRARAVAKVPFVITSGYRTQAHHDALTAQGYPTSSTSAHLKGLLPTLPVPIAVSAWTSLKPSWRPEYVASASAKHSSIAIVTQRSGHELYGRTDNHQIHIK